MEETLNDYYTKIDKLEFEGHVQQLKEQIDFLSEMVKKPNIINVLEIGFNGDSSVQIPSLVPYAELVVGIIMR